jgi:GTPase SAR1 family protein
VIIVIFDITNKDSFQDVEGYYTEGTRYSQRSLKYLVGNKDDLEDQRVVTTEQGEVFFFIHSN